jgi:hypothetical protein
MMASLMRVVSELHDRHPEVRAIFGEPRRMDAEEGACGTSVEARKSALLPSERERAHPGMTASRNDIDQITQRQRQ